MQNRRHRQSSNGHGGHRDLVVKPGRPAVSRLPVSAVIITFNCEHQLQACLESVAFAEEIIVVDSGSTDGTIDLAKCCGARVIEHPWLGYGRQKQLGVDQAWHDWVLCVDSDERITPELRSSIEQALIAPKYRALRFARCNRFMGRYLRHGEGYPDLSLRLFHRTSARWSEDEVHERVLAETEVGRLQGDLLHESADTLEGYLAKQNRYTSLAAEAALAAGKRAYPAQLLLSPLVRFIKFYLVRRGFLDGTPGLVHTLIGCSNSFMKYAKMLDLQIKRGIS